MDTTTAKATRLCKVLVDCHVEADLSGYLTWVPYHDIERRAKALEAACAELIDFIRDHRSRDPLIFKVVREYKDLCSMCEREWETCTEDGTTYCANCGAEIERD